MPLENSVGSHWKFREIPVKPVKIYWKPVKLHWMISATALKFPVVPGSLELAKRAGLQMMSRFFVLSKFSLGKNGAKDDLILPCSF